MAQLKMYDGMTNSPKTALADDISANDNSIMLQDSSVLPDAPNLAVIGTTSEAEVIIYGGMSGNRLTSVLRGQGGTVAKAWVADTAVARNFTIIDYNNICENIRDLENRKRNIADKIDAASQMSGILPVANGGTGVSTVAAIKALLELGALAFKSLVTLTTDVIGILPLANGGTGLSVSPSLLTNLASSEAAAVMTSAPRPGVTGVLPIANGGTGQSTIAAARNALGLGNTDGALPVANGGTGQTTVAGIRNAIGLGNTDGALPIANGGTGAVDVTGAKNNFGITDIASRPNYQISTSNLTPGTSALATGMLYFVYE